MHLPVIKDELSLIEAMNEIFSYAEIDASDFRIVRPEFRPDPDAKRHEPQKATSKSDVERWAARAELNLTIFNGHDVSSRREKCYYDCVLIFWLAIY